jgi:hypothetical protein
MFRFKKRFWDEEYPGRPMPYILVDSVLTRDFLNTARTTSGLKVAADRLFKVCSPSTGIRQDSIVGL